MTIDRWSPPGHNKIQGTWRGFRIARFPVWPATRQLIAPLAGLVGWNTERIAAYLRAAGYVIPEETIYAVIRDLGWPPW